MLVKVLPALLAYSQSLSYFLKAQLQALCYTSVIHLLYNLSICLSGFGYLPLIQIYHKLQMEFTAEMNELNEWHSAVVLFYFNMFLTDPVGMY